MAHYNVRVAAKPPIRLTNLVLVAAKSLVKFEDSDLVVGSDLSKPLSKGREKEADLRTCLATPDCYLMTFTGPRLMSSMDMSSPANIPVVGFKVVASTARDVMPYARSHREYYLVGGRVYERVVGRPCTSNYAVYTTLPHGGRYTGTKALGRSLRGMTFMKDRLVRHAVVDKGVVPVAVSEFIGDWLRK